MHRNITGSIFKCTSAATGLALLAACAGDSGRYPSLAIRDAERFTGQFQPASPAPSDPVPAVASSEDLLVIVDRAQDSHERFIEASLGVRRIVESARGLGIDTNARQQAFIALADLTAMRSDTATSLADLDLLEARAYTTFAPTEDVAAARALVASLVSEEDGTLDTLLAELTL